MIVCRVCKETKEKAKGQGNLCRVCSLEYQRQYRANNKERLKEYHAKKHVNLRENPEWVDRERKRGREFWKKLRHQAIMAYGGYECACCGEAEPSFLSLDHIHNDGAQHRRQLGYDDNGKGASSATLSWLKKNNYPPGIQVLCMNCNFGKQVNGGVCPHQSKKQNRVNSGDVSKR